MLQDIRVLFIPVLQYVRE